ncbi:MAG: cell division protein SepF [Lachnospiraceae bacterium]|jgi:cell division inhibitor SepF|nr:cell division protein SepF [Lachnospiraceae bacterium]MCR5319624.1 cell division protein SepF [Lachnospiraceae bacterium]
MGAAMESFLKFMKLNDEDEDFYLDDEELEEEAPRKSDSPIEKTIEPERAEEKPKRSLPKVTSNRQGGRGRMMNGNEVCVIKPTSVEDAKEITETLLSNRTVVLNLEGLDVDVAQRIIDFTSGSCFAISGNLQKISHMIFIVTPASVDISGDFQEIFNGSSFDVPINHN